MTHVDRHRPRLCPGCTAPWAGQSEVCWKCGAAWVEPPPAPVAAGAPGGEKAGSPG